MTTQYTVKLVGAKLFTAPPTGGKLKWHQGQERQMAEGDVRLPYYQGKRAFSVFVKQAPKDPVAPSARPKKPAKEKVEPETVDLDAAEAPPLAEAASELDDSPPGPDLPSDEELSEWLKTPLLELAEEHGLAVTSANTKKEIRAAIDTIR